MQDVILNFETAIDMIVKIEGRRERMEIIKRSGILASELEDEGNNL